MTVIELPDDLAAVLKTRAASQNLKLLDWLKQQAGEAVGLTGTEG